MEKQTRRFRKRALMILMTMTLATSCVVGSTYAKYATRDVGGDNAVIAKFGVKISANGKSFQNSYDQNSSKAFRSVVKSVLSANNVIAPGTKGEMIAMKITGKPEVSIKVEFNGQFAIANWEVIEKDKKVYYCPLTITVGGKDYFGMNYKNAQEFQDAVNYAIEGYSKEYRVEEFKDAVSIGEVIEVPSVSWRWDFEGDKIKDEYDTYLANRALEKVEEGKENDKVAGVTLFIETMIEQID